MNPGVMETLIGVKSTHLKTERLQRESPASSALVVALVIRHSAPSSGMESPMTLWGRNFRLLIRLTSKNYWLIGNANLRCSSAVGMDADVRFLEVAAKRKYTPLVSNISLFNATICTILAIN